VEIVNSMKPGKSQLFDINSIASHTTLPAEAAGVWCLPSGRALAEFVLSAGFATPRVWLGKTKTGRHSASIHEDICVPPARRRDARDFAAIEER